jgi:hypothetical protein
MTFAHLLQKKRNQVRLPVFLAASRTISMAGWAAPDPAISMILEAPQKGKKTSGFLCRIRRP